MSATISHHECIAIPLTLPALTAGRAAAVPVCAHTHIHVTCPATSGAGEEWPGGIGIQRPAARKRVQEEKSTEAPQHTAERDDILQIHCCKPASRDVTRVHLQQTVSVGCHSYCPICHTSITPGGTVGSSTAVTAALATASTLRNTEECVGRRGSTSKTGQAWIVLLICTGALATAPKLRRGVPWDGMQQGEAGWIARGAHQAQCSCCANCCHGHHTHTMM